MPDSPARSYARETAVATGIIATMSVLAACYVARVAFMPIVLALVLTTIFRPMVRWLEGARVPAPVSAPVLMIAVLVVAAAVLRSLAPPVQGFAHQLPKAVEQARGRLRTLPRPFGELAAAIPDLTSLTSSPNTVDTAGATTAPSSSPAQAQQQQQQNPRPTPNAGPLVGRVFGTATELLTGFLQTLLLLTFFLAGGNTWRRQIGRTRMAKAVTEVGDEVQATVSRYLVTLAGINLDRKSVV